MNFEFEYICKQDAFLHFRQYVKNTLVCIVYHVERLFRRERRPAFEPAEGLSWLWPQTLEPDSDASHESECSIPIRQTGSRRLLAPTSGHWSKKAGVRNRLLREHRAEPGQLVSPARSLLGSGTVQVAPGNAAPVRAAHSSRVADAATRVPCAGRRAAGRRRALQSREAVQRGRLGDRAPHTRKMAAARPKRQCRCVECDSRAGASHPVPGAGPEFDYYWPAASARRATSVLSRRANGHVAAGPSAVLAAGLQTRHLSATPSAPQQRRRMLPVSRCLSAAFFWRLLYTALNTH